MGGSNGRARDLFLSHCWRSRDEAVALNKRRVISTLSAAEAPRSAWADYLDLQAKGPVAWRE